MNVFLKAIGISNISTIKETDDLIEYVITNPDEQTVIEVSEHRTFAQFYQDYGNGVGVSVIGELEDKKFRASYCFPYCRGDVVSIQEELQLERHMDREAYAGIAEDVNIGVALIFFVQNVDEYLNYNLKHALNPVNQVILSGLSVSATVILEVKKSRSQIRDEKELTNLRNSLLSAARSGDATAIESLTIDDMDTYSLIAKRSRSEDVYTIVDSYFMPYGISSDQYSILGNILEVSKFKNSMTNEVVIKLLVECNNLKISICINKNDLVGHPMVGRRFKGIVWLQGQLII